MTSDDRGPVSVGEVTRFIADLLADSIPRISIRGQLSNVRLQRSGHLYFSLKDHDAQIGCAMWRSRVSRVRFKPEDGQEVVATGRIEVYPPHGKYQLIVETLAPLGVGELHMRFEQLKRQLADEGLFEPQRKRGLPLLPRRVAIVTSPTSAALRDMLRVAYRRMPGAWITVFPCRVQGDVATSEIVAALESVARVGDFDAVIVGRGGGSIEDLWCFNEEAVARAIAASPVPVVSAVGHESDTTIADYVADARAATPSEAAEIVFPETAELEARIAENRARVERAATERLRRASDRLDALGRTHALARPLERMRRMAQELDEWDERAIGALGRRVDRARDRVTRTAAHLQAVSPLSILSRGYSITSREGHHETLKAAADVAVGDTVRTRLAAGELLSTVTETLPDSDGDAA